MCERIVNLDIAKAICIVLVVIGHYLPDGAPNWYAQFHNVIYTFHMPLFMFASGYIFIATRKDNGYGNFLAKKVKRLLVPYFTTSIIIISFKLLTQGQAYVEHPVSVLSYIRMFYQPEAGYFLWFVLALWWMFVIVPLFKTKRSRLLLFAFAVIIHFIPISFTSVFCINEFKRMMIYFMFGVVLYEYDFMRSFMMSFAKYRACCVTILFIAAEVLYNGKAIGGGNFRLLSYLLPFIGILFIIEISNLIERYAKKAGRCLNTIMLVSASSYIIYLFHTTFEGFAKAICHKLPLDIDIWYVFVSESVFVILIGVVVPVVLYKYVLKRYSIARILFGL